MPTDLLAQKPKDLLAGSSTSKPRDLLAEKKAAAPVKTKRIPQGSSADGPTSSGAANQFFIGAANSTLWSVPELTHKEQFDQLESPYPEERIARGVGTAVGSVIGLPGVAWKMGSKLATKGIAKLAPEMVKVGVKASPMAKAIVEGAGGGGAYNLLDPTTPIEDKPLNTLGGIISGGAVGAAGHVVGEQVGKLPDFVKRVFSKKVDVPNKFNSTEEALLFGYKHKDNPKVLEELFKRREAAVAENKALMALENPTDEQMQEGMNIAVKGQLYREALEASEGKISQRDLEKIQKTLGLKSSQADAGAVAKINTLNEAVGPPRTFLPTGEAAMPNPRAELVPSFKRLVPQDAKKLIEDLDKRQTEILAADRGIISAKNQNELSKGIDADKILSDWQPGATVNAEGMFALRNKLVDKVLKITEHTTAEEIEKLSHEFIKADAMASETGRTLGSLNKVQSMASDQIKFLTEHFKVLSPEGQAAAAKVFKQFQAPGFWDKFMEYRTASLLTSPYTHVRNAIGNLIPRLYGPIHKVVAGGADMVRAGLTGTPRSVFASEGIADVVGVYQGFKPALRNALARLSDENFISESRMMEAVRHNQAISGLKGKIVRSPFRALDAMDEFFTTLGHNASLYSQATRQALKEGSKDWIGRAAQLVKSPSMLMIGKAKEAALKDTYRQPMGPAMSHLQAFFNGQGVVSRAAKFIVPFFKTPVNLFTWGYQRGPVTSMLPGSGNWKAIMKGTPEQKAEAWAKIAIGQMVGAGIGFEVLNGNVTGRLSGSREKREALMRQGVQPYSIKIGDKYVSYRSYEPLSSWLALTANAIETAKEEGKLDETTAVKVTAETVKMMKDQSFLQGISDLTSALDDPERYGQKFIQNAATSLIPTGVGYLSRLYDPVLREPDSIPESIKARLPYFSKSLPPKLDVWGRPITKEGTLSQRAWLPSGVMTSKPDMAENELLSLEKFPQKINRKYKGLNLTVEERNLITRSEGALEKTYLDKMVEMAEYKALTPEEQSQAVEKMFAKVRKEVRTPFFQEKFIQEFRKLKTGEERAQLLEKYTNKKLIKKEKQ